MKIDRPQSRQPLPENAKLVFKGIIFDVYHWEVQGYDGSIKIFETLKRPDTVVIIPVTQDGKIVMSNQEQPGKKPFVGLVGGRVDEGEEVFDAAKRELLEETGLDAEDWVLLDAVQPASKIEWAVYTFVARGCKKVSEQNLDGAERIELKHVGFDEFFDMATSETFEDIELKIKLLEAKLDPNKMIEIKKLILG